MSCVCISLQLFAHWNRQYIIGCCGRQIHLPFLTHLSLPLVRFHWRFLRAQELAGGGREKDLENTLKETNS